MVVAAERGDLALVPYYTVRDQWVTGIHIVNTSDHTQVVKFRFRRATDGMDALDFNIVMSPKDVYAGFLSDDENGTISWASTDTTCTVPATQGNRFTMPAIYRVGAESGYVEIIAMGQAESEQQPIAVAAKHSAATATPPLTPLDCAAVSSNFFADGRARVTDAAGAIAVAGIRGVVANNRTYQPGVTSSNPTVRSGGNNSYVDSGNALKVSYFIRDRDTGIEFGDNAVHIANFLEVPSITNQEYGINSGDLNGFDFPDLDGTGLPRGALLGTIVRNRFNMLRRGDVLGVDSIINEWSVNPVNGVEMDWVVTLPGQYLMLRLPQYLASLGADRAWYPTVSPAGSVLENPRCPRQRIAANPVTGAAEVDDCDFRDQPLELEYVAYNREEFKGEVGTGTLVVSPQAPAASATTYLPKVANVITFGGKSVLGQSDANVNANLGQPFGWLEARLKQRSGNKPRVCAWNSARDGVSTPNRPLSATAGQELTMDCTTARAATGEVPVIGFAAWARKVAANPDVSYGRIVEHSYRVLAPQAPAPAPAPGAPTGLTATPGNGQVTVSWSVVPGAMSYKVYYSTSPISDLTATGVRSVTVTTTTITGLTNGTPVFFRVTVTTAGGESAASNEASATPTATTTTTTTAGTVFSDPLKDGGQGPEMVVLPTGSFKMGSPSTETGRYINEGPVRTVTIGKRIAMGRYEVTFDDYNRFTADSSTTQTLPADEGWGRGSRPVINVSQVDAKAYATWLSAQTGKTYRLPSEAEWEYAARAGTTTAYPWGNGFVLNRANCFGCGSAWDNKESAPVGSFAANAFGLYDLHGNVWEWVEDCLHNNYEGAPSDGSAWTTSCDGSVRAVARGGSWNVNPRFLRSAYRAWGSPSDRSGGDGFRLVQDLNP